MKKFINYGSIGRFEEFFSSLKRQYTYRGVDANDDPIYDESKLLPTLQVSATEKIHGTNASVCYNNKDGFWVQKRKSICTIEKDNAGAAANAMMLQDKWIAIIQLLAEAHNIDLNEKTISVYYEWCGEGIQKSTCVSGLSKRAIIFQHFKASPITTKGEVYDPNEDCAEWYETFYIKYLPIDSKGFTFSKSHWASDNENGIYNTADFHSEHHTVNFNDANAVKSFVELMEKLTLDIETNSKIAAGFDKPDNIGEGYVWTYLDGTKLHRWKSKGEKHVGKSKVKQRPTKPLDTVKEAKVKDFANSTVTEGRLQQAWQETFGIANEKEFPSRKFTGAFIKWVVGDIHKEEVRPLLDLGLSAKDVNGTISSMAKSWFFTTLTNELMGQ